MVKLRYILVMVLMATASTPVFAGWKVVIDKNCIKVVAANTASQKLIEDQHNQRLDSIASKKQKVELYSVSMATTLQAHDGEHFGFRDGEPVLQGNRHVRL